MRQLEKGNTKTVVLTALFAALVFVATRINVPTGMGPGQIVHFGDGMIYLGACILPMPYAMAAGAIGAGLSDALTPGCMVYVLPTMLIKSLLVVYFTNNHTKFMCLRNNIGAILAGVTGGIGYAIVAAVLAGNMGAALPTIPGSMIQATGSGVIFILVGYSFDKMRFKQKIIVS